MSNFIKSLVAVAVVMNAWIGLAGPSLAQGTVVVRPEVSINPPTVNIARDRISTDNLKFIVTANPVPLTSRTINIEIKENNSVVRTITRQIKAGEGEVEIEIPVNDLVLGFEENQKLDAIRAVTIASGVGYEPAPAPNNASTVTVTPPPQTVGWITLTKKIEGTDQHGAFKFRISGSTNRFEYKTSEEHGRAPPATTTMTVNTAELNGRSRTFAGYVGTVTIQELPDPDGRFKLQPGVGAVVCKHSQGGAPPVVRPTVSDQGSFDLTIEKNMEDYDCEITNTYVPPVAPIPPTLIIKKIVKAPDSQVPFEARDFKFNFTDASIEPANVRVTKLNEAFASRSISLENVTNFFVTEAAQDDYRIDESDNRFGCRVNDAETTIGFAGPTGFLFVENDLAGLPSAAKITCTFVNVPVEPPTVTIVKEVQGLKEDQAFNFFVRGGSLDETVTIMATVKSDAVNGQSTPDDSPKLIDISGDITIRELVPDGFKIKGASCELDGKPIKLIGPLNFKTASFTVNVPETGDVKCIVENEKALPPTLIVEKIVKEPKSETPFAEQKFTFEFIDLDIEPRPIPVRQRNKKFETLSISLEGVSTFAVVEAKNDDYKLDDTDPRSGCRVDGKGDRIDEFSERDRGFAVGESDLPKTGEVRCTFVNVPKFDPPTLIVEKVVEGGGTGTFNFSSDNPSLRFPALRIESAEANTDRSDPLATTAGQKITITETFTGDFTFKNAVCRLGKEQIAASASGATIAAVTVTMPNTGEVICTFTNLTVPDQPPEEEIFADVIIKKVTRGGVGTFNFIAANGRFSASRTITAAADNDARGKVASGSGKTEKISVPIGTVTITEEKHKSFKFVSATCDGGSPRANASARNVAFTLVEGATVTCTFVNREVAGTTISIITGFLYRRAQQLLGDTGRPRLVERRQNSVRGGSLKDALGVQGQGSMKDGTVSFRTRLQSALVDDTDAKAARFGIRPSDYGIQTRTQTHRSGWDVWTEGRINYYRSDATYDGSTTSGHFGVVRIGTDYLISPRFLVGFLAQYDSIREDNGSGPDGYHVSGKGFMIGPYAEYQLSKGLYFDAKVLWGKSTNDISPFNTYTDSFGTTRVLAAARLTGSWDYQVTSKGVLHFSPRAEVAYFSESSDSYVDSNDINIAGQEVNLGRVTIGPEVSYRHVTPAGTRIEPRIAAKALWSFGNADPKGLDAAFVSNVSERKVNRFGIQFSGGLVIEAPDGLRLDVQGDYTGLGGNDEMSAGGKVNITVPLQSQR